MTKSHSLVPSFFVPGIISIRFACFVSHLCVEFSHEPGELIKFNLNRPVFAVDQFLHVRLVHLKRAHYSEGFQSGASSTVDVKITEASFFIFQRNNAYFATFKGVVNPVNSGVDI